MLLVLFSFKVFFFYIQKGKAEKRAIRNEETRKLEIRRRGETRIDERKTVEVGGESKDRGRKGENRREGNGLREEWRREETRR